MTVTLPRALEVCGVTRSIRCPFKCVPYKSKLHCTMKSHITTFLYPTIPQLCPTVILKGKECKASSERAQGQRAAHKGRGSHLSTVVPLHICCRLPQGSPIHCLQDQYLCSYNYRLLWPCLIISCVGIGWDVFWRLIAFIIEHPALIGMRKIDTKWVSLHFFINTPML